MKIPSPEDLVNVAAIRKLLFKVRLTKNVSPLGSTDALADNSTSSCRWVGMLELSVSKGTTKQTA